METDEIFICIEKMKLSALDSRQMAALSLSELNCISILLSRSSFCLSMTCLSDEYSKWCYIQMQSQITADNMMQIIYLGTRRKINVVH